MDGLSQLNTLRYYPEKCIGCRFCIMVCPHGVFTQNGKVAQLIHSEDCMECGACQRNCPADAIEVDSGVGCATAMIWAALRGKKEVSCGGGQLSCCSEAKEKESKDKIES